MQQLVNLVGIARLASEGSTLAEKNRVEYRTLPTRKWLNRCHSQRVPFQWTINPYRGCEYGCKYCYARFTHEFLERRKADAFETEIYAKDWDRNAFQQELGTLKPGDVIGLGTATDPYQPAERQFERTRHLLEAMVSVRDIALFVTTKSDLVARDADLYGEIAKRNDVRVSVTVTTLDRVFARRTEPFAPRPDLRLQAVKELAKAGVPVGVIASPVLPLLTDSETNLKQVAAAARQASARFFAAGVLFLKPAAKRVFFAFLADQHPHLLKRYQASYEFNSYLRGSYPDRIAQMVDGIRDEFGFAHRDLSFAPPPPVADSQLRLF